ncbi:MAG: CRISPR-associated endonuclease Cas2 [Methanothrix sp.]|nr:CRISPR-associated endonuclease Cas2 [Methanothrix sp.]
MTATIGFPEHLLYRHCIPRLRRQECKKLDDNGRQISSAEHDLRRLLKLNRFPALISVEPAPSTDLAGHETRWLKCYVVSYDIMDPKRLHHVHKTMKGFGDPIHYSVFRRNLTDRGKIELVAALTEIIKHDDDRIMIVDLGPLDGRVEERIEFLGVHPSRTESKAVVV